MSRVYDAAGKRISSKTHARRGHECEICGRTVYGNGGKVAHGRSHVRAGEAIELVKHYADGPLRVFIAADDEDQIARLTARGFTALEIPTRAAREPGRRPPMKNISSAEQDRFHELVLAGVPIEKARDYARQDTAVPMATQLLGAVDGARAIWRYSDDRPILVRDQSMDHGDQWAWRFEQPCTIACHHPVHALGHPERLRHVEWFTPGTSALAPAGEYRS